VQTTPLDARLDSVIELPEQNVWTLVMPFTMLLFCIGALLKSPWLIAASGTATLLAMARWMWPGHVHPLETET
jgi:hypothetical protein